MSIKSNRRVARRAFLKSASQLGAAALAGRLLPGLERPAFAQAAVDKSRLIVRSVRPEDLETPVTLFNSWLTPNELFYVRSHLYTPAVKADEWRLTVDGEVERPLTLTLDELKRLPAATVTVTLECAGNGRAFFDPPVAGIQWEKGAVGTARWTGVRLADLLKRAGLKPAARFIELNGADRPVGKVPDFIRQVPLAKAMHADTILAFEMNGQPIPVQHGFPLRAVVPGWEGAYAVKWLTHVRALDRESDAFFVKTGYRYPTRRVAPGEAVDAKDMAPLLGLVVKSIITAPGAGTKVKAGALRVTGFAWAGENDIARVEISTDGGATWQAARLGRDRAPYSWRQFEFDWTVREPGHYIVMSRATDSRGNVQPIQPMWNPSGYLWNAIDRVEFDVEA